MSILRGDPSVLEAAVAQLGDWQGQRITISESISRQRTAGSPHDRHFATQSRLHMTLGFARVTVSGARLALFGAADECCYEMALGAVTSIVLEDAGISVCEQFETETERLSVIALADVNTPPSR